MPPMNYSWKIHTLDGYVTNPAVIAAVKHFHESGGMTSGGSIIGIVERSSDGTNWVYHENRSESGVCVAAHKLVRLAAHVALATWAICVQRIETWNARSLH